ncbi:MAG TPA: MBL fold metallo-hydrolase [Thermoanaerobaculia bacterium]|jgi:glyoxylase-like metal-dependent hydrolase (beta-lactamase superfamily II)|nr:MBL fold metallo-hydrolase [Thermoanaerobaculia bacterium]
MNIRTITAPNPGPFTLTGTQTYLIGETAILDPGPLIESHVEALCAAMPNLRTILITHRHGDHAPAAIPLKEATGAEIIAPRNVLDDSDVDRRVAGGETLMIDDTRIDVIATPGHTNEHVCYFTADGDLFTGDTILGYGTTAIFPPDGHMGDYFRSLETLRSLNPRRIYPAHGPVRDDAMPLIEQYIAHRLERERQILDAFANGAETAEEMRAIIYPDLDERLRGAAEIQITAHLIKLKEEGAI